MNLLNTSMDALNTVSFKHQCQIIYGDLYDYSKVVYINSKTKVTIGCPLHGVFHSTPNNHKNGKGCPRCGRRRTGMTNTRTTEHFIEKAKKHHNNKYDYSKALYIGNKKPIAIICPVHGEFIQTPSNHYRFGCLKCGRDQTTSHQQKRHDQFVTEAISKHLGKYSYKSPYMGAHRKITIYCSDHGLFQQTPGAHLRGHGCPQCKQGKNHPRYGKSSPGSKYSGEYNKNIFRSLTELTWMLRAEANNIAYVALDQPGNRQTWQVSVLDVVGKHRTYCPDFLIINEKKIIDIKPDWRVPKEEWKLKQAKEFYATRGYIFETVSCDTITIDYKEVEDLWRKGIVAFYPAGERRIKKRLNIQ